jgi:hypothetical protein
MRERIIEHRLRGVTNVSENQFGFMLKRSTMEAIFLIRKLMEEMQGAKEISAYDFHWPGEVSTNYISLIMDMYDNIVTSGLNK